MKLLKHLPYTLAHRTTYNVPSTERGKQETHWGGGEKPPCKILQYAYLSQVTLIVKFYTDVESVLEIRQPRDTTALLVTTGNSQPQGLTLPTF